MGPTKKRKYKAKKQNPVGIPSIRDAGIDDDEDDDVEGVGPVVTVTDMLTSAKNDEEVNKLILATLFVSS